MSDFYHIMILLTFIVGYLLITIEHTIKINKTAVAMAMAVVAWLFLYINPSISHDQNTHALMEHLSGVSQVVFFLLGALAIVETINVHRGFNIISNYINIRSKKTLLWLIGIVTFFMSSVLDNLTTTIIMVTLIRKLVPKGEERLLIGGAIVIAANAGGAWTPIGDVTTTMLWIGQQLSTVATMRDLFIPSLTCLIVSLGIISLFLKGNFPDIHEKLENEEIEPFGREIFWIGIGCLIFVPIFKILTGLPPFMGMTLVFAFVWIITDLKHYSQPGNNHLRLPYLMSKIDISSILFFFGILLCIDALDTAGMLQSLANWLDQNLGNTNLIAVTLGFLSAIVDNVPLVAAIMGMYDLSTYPIDSNFWQLIAYCAGTGGSILVIGSAAGVAFMGMERVSFFWYLRKVGVAAAAGYLGGFAIYYLMYT